MKNKVKLMVGILGFAIFILGAYLLYGSLQNKMSSDNMIIENNEGSIHSDDGQGEQETINAINFTVTDKDGNKVNLSDFFGKPIVLNFWASWCPPCKKEMPDFNEVYQEFNEKVIFLMINVTDGQRETVEKAKQYVEDMGYSFPVYFDTEDDASYNYGITSIPTTIFIDEKGDIVAGSQGAISKETLLKGIELISSQENKTSMLENANLEEVEPIYSKISAEEAYEFMKSDSEAKDVVVLDVRTQQEFEDSHIPDAILIPDYEIEEAVEEKIKDKESIVLVYCRSGRRSENAAKELIKLGYNQVYDFGGIIDWPYETT